MGYLDRPLELLHVNNGKHGPLYHMHNADVPLLRRIESLFRSMRNKGVTFL